MLETNTYVAAMCVKDCVCLAHTRIIERQRSGLHGLQTCERKPNILVASSYGINRKEPIVQKHPIPLLQS